MKSILQTDTTEADVSQLEPHPKNRDVYTTRENTDLVKRIQEYGFKDTQRIVVCQDGTILSGHRRWDAAKQAGVESVPVEVVDVEPDSDEALLELLTANDYRDKTPSEIINEGEVWEEIEQKRAKERELSGGTVDLPEGSKGETREKVGEKIGVSGSTYERGKTVKDKAKSGDETAQEEWNKLESGEQSIHGAYASVKESERNTEQEPETETPELPDSTYRTVVIDPPWPIEKIGRDERPEQGKYLDYPTMDLQDIRNLPIEDLAAESGSHIYLWTTQKHIPDAMDILDEWGARYECMLTWVKPTGVAPFSWQYNTEHVLFARYGDGLKMNEMGQQISFSAPVKEHSEKPDVFYDRVRNASEEPRIELFARESRMGFDVWGDEVTTDGD